MTVEIRPLNTHQEYRAAEQLQRQVWNLEEYEIVPDHMLLTAQKNGGLVLGAFDGPQLVGFVFGFLGLTAEGQLKHCSHMAGVLPAYQNQHLGYRLKLAQRQHVLSQGINLITWTFDPLESRNARLNLHKLGAICRTYLRDLYGSMRDALNTGLPSDRLLAEWHLDSERVIQRLQADHRLPDLATLQDAGVPIINEPTSRQNGLLQPADQTLPLSGERLLLRIPADFQAIKQADMSLALAWRLHVRELLDAAFAAGYAATDLLFDGRQSCYLLERAWGLSG